MLTDASEERATGSVPRHQPIVELEADEMRAARPLRVAREQCFLRAFNIELDDQRSRLTHQRQDFINGVGAHGARRLGIRNADTKCSGT